MRKLAAVLIILVCHHLSSAQKSDSTLIIEISEAESEPVEIDFTPPPPPPKDFKSPYNSIAEWLLNFPLDRSATQNAIFNFRYYYTDKQYFLYLQQIYPNEKGIPFKAASPSQPFYHTIPVNLPESQNWKNLNERFVAEIKDFVTSDSFTKSTLSAARAIVNGTDQKVIWYREPDNPEPELKRLRDIILAAIDYNTMQDTGRMVLDGVDNALYWAKVENNRALKYFVFGSMEKLQKAWIQTSQKPFYNVDLNFERYIKQKTGYDVDLFSDARKKVKEILKRNKINNSEEARIAYVMERLFRQFPEEKENADHLDSLVSEHRKQEWENYTSKQKQGSGEPAFKYTPPVTVSSPNEKFSVNISKSENNRTASVFLNITGGGGTTIYSAAGLEISVNAHWKDSHTLVIETKHVAEEDTKHYEVRSFNDVIKIEYLTN